MPTSTNPRFRRLEPDERRASIIAAATELFSKNPYSKVGTATIASRAGVARGLLNHYFGTKRDLYLEVIRESATVPQDAVDTLPEGDLTTRIDASVRWFLDAVESQNMHSWMIGAAGNDPEVERILIQAESASVERVIEALGLADVTDQAGELRALVRSYGQLARAAAREWLHKHTITRSAAHRLMAETLHTLAVVVYPAIAGETALLAENPTDRSV